MLSPDWFIMFTVPPPTWPMSHRLQNFCMAKKTLSMQTPDTPVPRSAKSMKIVRLSGRSQRATVPIPRWYKDSVFYKIKRKIEYCKAKTRAKVEHPFRVIKRQFGYVKVRFRGLMKKTAQLTTLFALSNLWMVRKQLMGTGELRV